MGWFSRKNKNSEKSIAEEIIVELQNDFDDDFFNDTGKYGSIKNDELIEIPYLEFVTITKYVANSFKQLTIEYFDDWIVHCEVRSHSGLSQWNFRVDFTYFDSSIGYDIWSENNSSTLPENFARRVIDYIQKYNRGDNKYNTSSNSIYCWKCGRSNSRDNMFCDFCGAQQDKLQESVIQLKIEQEKTKQDEVKAQSERDKRRSDLEERKSKRALEEAKERTRQQEISQVNSEKTRNFLKNIAPWLVLALVFYLSFQLYQDSQIRSREAAIIRANQDVGNIQLPFDSFDFKNDKSNEDNPIKYQSVEEDFANAGFTNITTQKQKDLGFIDWKNKNGNVVSVTINGNADFSRGEWYSKDAKIKITYHSKK